MGRPRSNPIYMLPHGIEVIGEYGPNNAFPYWRFRIREHPLFDAKVISGGMYVHRSRAVMTSKIGRMLLKSEHVHHKNDNKNDDSPGNLVILSASNHNKLHHLGLKHSPEAKERISSGLKLAILEGRMAPGKPPSFAGEKHTAESKRRISETRKRLIANGDIARQTPPSWKGKKHSKGTIEKMKLAAQCRQRN